MASPSSSQTLTLSLDHLDHDHMTSILLLLPFDSIISFALTCKKFKSLAFSESLWELLCRRDWGSGTIDSLLATLSENERREFSYRKLYEKVSMLGSLSCRRLICKGDAFPKPRASHSLNLVSDWLVLFGGGCEGGRHLDDTWVAYVGSSRTIPMLTWQPVNSGLPGGRFGHSCTLVGKNSLILFGGINDNGSRLNDTWIGQILYESPYNVKVLWKPLEVGQYTPPPRGAHAACCIGDCMVLVHGGIGLHGLRLGDTWVLDLSGHACWYQVATADRLAPSPRSGHSLTWIGGTRMAVLFGGRGEGYDVLNDVWLFDVEGFPRWKEVKFNLAPNFLNAMPSPRVGHSASLTLGNKILIYGGEDSERHRKDDFWILDVLRLLQYQAGLRNNTKGIWKQLNLVGGYPSFRAFHSACTDLSGRFLYVFGGMVDGYPQLAEANSLRFDGESYQVELILNL
ncbi:hypothetical protein LUZ63_006529 [Rhynchospora breviuscula]|uniref:F-box domain-containing protein n=1 Tax=Rhynchospora breviuscula TaxID=2022672 RepID=A0A9Q0CQP9_9POAL|nr:hypothetical protein LUZ63_006529 [Rhynchospora breviuscula]